MPSQYLLRKAVLDDLEETIKGVTGPPEYIHHVHVYRSLRSLAQVNKSEQPYIAIIGGDSNSVVEVSRTEEGDFEALIFMYVEPDTDRWPDKGSAELLEEVLGDVEKSLDFAPYRRTGELTMSVVHRRRSIETTNDPNGRYSAFLWREIYEYKRRF